MKKTEENWWIIMDNDGKWRKLKKTDRLLWEKEGKEGKRYQKMKIDGNW